MIQVLQTLAKNTLGRDFVVGDLHGYYAELMQALEQVSFDFTQDRLLAVGDLINRGPDSYKCLQLVNEPWFFSVQGNHERLMVHSLAGSLAAYKAWQKHGGGWAALYKEEELQEMVRLIHNKMPLAIEVSQGEQCLGIVHAEVPQDDWSILRQWQGEPTRELLDSTALLRKRLHKNLDHPVANIDAVACGHTLVKKPTRLGNVTYLETGICAPQIEGYLTLVEATKLLQN
ncbi:metallophosphoesterase [Marinospirillum insulare]|uniref:Serine/threonine protein phosphatase n=1 Tax=Marinospirillum insulare TaxID=217169 RepID=A0ABQ5ZU01_9GAMM|nr:metallophosphoesterase [Marinospirillum insulare]GLR62906.1 serine/threonine protein phosphatase [Marinospirillum insulare]